MMEGHSFFVFLLLACDLHLTFYLLLTKHIFPNYTFSIVCHKNGFPIMLAILKSIRN